MKVQCFVDHDDVGKIPVADVDILKREFGACAAGMLKLGKADDIVFCSILYDEKDRMVEARFYPFGISYDRDKFDKFTETLTGRDFIGAVHRMI